MDEATEKRILDILRVFKICDATQILEYRYKHRLIREVIHRRVPEDFWQTMCAQQFPKIYIEGKKRSGLLWRELYNAFTLWKNVEKTKVELIEITMPDTKSYNFLAGRKISCSHRLMDECPEENADMIVHYDLNELAECYRKTCDAFNSFYENHDMLIRQSGQSLYVTPKAFPDCDDVADDIRPETTWTVLDNDIYYQKDDADTQSMWRCTVGVSNDRPNYDKEKLIDTSGQMLDVTEKDDNLYALYTEFQYDVALVGINGNGMELCEELNGDNWYKLTEQYALDWTAPRTFPVIRDKLDSTVFNNYDFEVVVSHQNLIVAATKTRPIKILAYHVKYDDSVLTFEPISPLWSVVIDDHLEETSQLRNRENATITSLGIVEITCGHRILAIYCNKVIIIELTHVDLLRYYKDDDTSSSEQEPPVGMPKPVSPMPESSPDEGTEEQGNVANQEPEPVAGPSRPPLEADTPMRIIAPVMSPSELVVSSTTDGGSGFRSPAAFPQPSPDRPRLWPRFNLEHHNGLLDSRANRDRRPPNRMLADDSGDDNAAEDEMEAEPVDNANNTDSDNSNDERREMPVLMPPNYFDAPPNGVALDEELLMDRAAHNIRLIDGNRNATMNGERLHNPSPMRHGGNGAALSNEIENENNENAEREGAPDNAWQGSHGMVHIHTANISIGGNGSATHRGRRRARSNLRNLITQATPHVASPSNSSEESDSNSSGSLRIPTNEDDNNTGRGRRHVDNSGGGAAGPSGSGGGAAGPSGSGGGAAGPSGSGVGAAGPSGSGGGAARSSGSGGRQHPRLQAEMQNEVQAMPALPPNDPANEQQAAEEERPDAPPRNETLRQSPLLSLRMEYSSASDSSTSVKRTSESSASDNQPEAHDARREDDNTSDSANSDRNTGSGTSNLTDDDSPPPLEDSRVADDESSGMSGSVPMSSGRSDSTGGGSGAVTEEERSRSTDDSPPSSLTNDDNLQLPSPATQRESPDETSGPSQLQPGSADGSGSAKSDRMEEDNSPESEDAPSPVEEPSDVLLHLPSSVRKHDHDDDDNDDGPKATKIPRLEE